MQNFIRVTLISLLLLVIIQVFRLEGDSARIHLPQWLFNLHQNLLAHFEHPQNANFLFSVFTGDKKGLSPGLLREMEVLNLRFLLSPGGLHLTGFLFFFKKKKFPIYLTCWFLPSFYSLKRMALLRFMTLFKKKTTQINLFYLTFFVSFIIGHFFKSPLGFTYNFLLVGTFFSIRQMSFWKRFLAISTSQLLICFFSGNNFSFIGMSFSLLLVQLFSLLIPLFIIFILSFYLVNTHWVEPIIRFFIILIHYAAKLTHGTSLTSSFMLFIVLWILLLNKKKKWLLICLLFHVELAHAPLIYYEGSAPQARLAFGHR